MSQCFGVLFRQATGRRTRTRPVRRYATHSCIFIDSMSIRSYEYSYFAGCCVRVIRWSSGVICLCNANKEGVPGIDDAVILLPCAW